MELIPPKKDQQEIISLLDHHTKKAEDSVKKMASNYIKEAEVDVIITKVEFKEMDSANLNHGAAYFEVTLKGAKAELEKIVGDDLLFIYDWENPSVEGLSNNSKHNLILRNNVSMLDATKNKTMKKTVNKGDWTKPKHLSSADWRDLKNVKKLFDERKLKEAMKYASDLDTIVREEIPPEIWQAMGGELTKTGKEKLTKKLNPSKFNNRGDDLNPRFMFSITASQLLSEALKGEFDINYLMRKELANRGQDKNGKWVGFDKAKTIHKVE